ncbi:MAG: exodeoxyribonuclease VII large subunit [Ignavibacteriales bacterium]|nr:exodeoxyribonuclease VII large subunit [Ignavibacteriales bacterium]
MDKKVLSVSEISNLIKTVVEENFSSVVVEGEISNFKAHISGHWYFTLKDSKAQINCAMWKGYNNYVFFTPQDGIKVVVTGRVSVYTPRGNYQIDVQSMKPAGEGELQAAFEKLKRKLSEEGLFDEVHKKPIPRFSKRIGIVTAIDGAAFKDMISVAKRRFPLVELVIISTKVQGDGAAEQVAENIKLLNKRDDIDLIIIGRGGGSIEDLWAFNEEVVARAIFKSRIPVISAVGHEIDYTISDFVADLRAPTPTAAMELATPDKEDILYNLENYFINSTEIVSNEVDERKDKIHQLISSYAFRMPESLMTTKAQILDNLFYRIEQNFGNYFLQRKNRTDLLSAQLNAHNADKILRKGFSIVHQFDKIVERAKSFNKEKKFSLQFFDKKIQVGKND